MRLPKAAVLLAYLSSAQAQVTVCFATYGTETTSVLASGLDLLIQVITPHTLARRQAISPDSGYLDSTGQIQPDCQKGSVFRLASGQLSSGGEQVSVSPGDPLWIQRTGENVMALDKMFAVATDNKLVWNNDEFEGGTARFGADSSGMLYGVGSGSMPSNCTAVTLKVLGVADCPNAPQIPSSIPSLAPSGFPALPSYFNSSMPLLPPFSATPLSSASGTIASVTTPTVPPFSPPDFSEGGRLFTFPAALDSSSSALLPSALSVISSFSLPLPSTSLNVFPSSASNNSTTSAGSTFGSLTIPPLATSSSGMNQARSIISLKNWTDWCSELLGYATSSGTTFSLEATVSSILILTSPSVATTTHLDKSSVIGKETLPVHQSTIIVTPTLTVTISDVDIYTATTITNLETNTVTPIYTNPNAKLRARQASSAFSTPGPLQSFAASQLSLACSQIATSPPAAQVFLTTFITTDFVQTLEVTGTTETIQSTSIISEISSVISGSSTLLETDAITIDVTVPGTTMTATTTDVVISTDTITAPTIYPNCVALVTELNGQPISIIDDSPNNVTTSQTSSAYDCCVACQVAPNCGAMFFLGGTCNMIMASSCAPTTLVGSFESFGSAPGYTLANGTCGMLTHRGVLGTMSG